MQTPTKNSTKIKWLLLVAVLLIGAISYWAIEIRPAQQEAYTFFNVVTEFKLKGSITPTYINYVTNVLKTGPSSERTERQRTAAIQQARERISKLSNLEYIKNAFARNDNYKTYQEASTAMYELVRDLDEAQAKGYLKVETVNLVEVADR